MTVSYMNLTGGEPTKELFAKQLIETSPDSLISIDFETISLEDRVAVGFGIGTSPNEAWYFRILPEPDPEITLVLPLLERRDVKKVMHNAPFDLAVSLQVHPMDTSNIADTNVMARLLGYNDTKLARLHHFHKVFTTNIEAKLTECKAKSTLQLPTQWLSDHCCLDCIATYRLYMELLPQMPDHKYLEAEMKAIPIIVRMGNRGIKVDPETLKKLEEDYSVERDAVIEVSQMMIGGDFNIGSNKQVGEVLVKRGNFLPMTRKRTQYKTDDETLQKVHDPLAQLVLKYRKISKVLSTYVLPLIGQDRAFTSYNLDARVGRISSSDIDMQNIPKKLRKIFMPDNGIFSSGDYSQLHLRILCFLSSDKQMEAVYYHGEFEGSIHKKTARELGIGYDTAKTVNYAIPYGASPETLAAQLGSRDIQMASTFLSGWFRTYKQAADWLQFAQDYAVKYGKSLPTLFGREIHIPYEGESSAAVASVRRKGGNYPILGSDGEIAKRALAICEEEVERKQGFPLAVTVHDSLSVDGPITWPKDMLENITPFRVPFETKSTFRWE